MFKPELWQSHDEYRTIVKTYGRRLSRNPQYAFKSYEKECRKLLGLDLDAISDFVPGFYSAAGRPAKNQAQILRSLILFVLLCNRTSARTSLTAWVTQTLPRSIALTVLAGCTSPDQLPPLGTPARDNPEAALQKLFFLPCRAPFHAAWIYRPQQPHCIRRWYCCPFPRIPLWAPSSFLPALLLFPWHLWAPLFRP